MSVVSGEARTQYSAPGNVLRPRWGQEGRTGANLWRQRAQTPGRKQPVTPQILGTLLPEGACTLLQSHADHILIFLLAKGTRGVDKALQRGEGKCMAQSALLEPCQGV